MREISNLAHALEGVVLGAVAVIVIAQALGLLSRDRTRYLWPALIVLAGGVLLGYLLIPHHGLAKAGLQYRFVFGDAQQRQHMVIAVLLLAAGVVELRIRAGRLDHRWWSLAWPATMTAIGLLFLIHPQHGTSDAVARATMVHRFLGTAMLSVGLLGGVEARRDRRSDALTAAWGSALLLAAVLLLVYREPAGAFHEPMSHDTTGRTTPHDSMPR
jgi:uncharacterized membrane protein HdeD (DUF308 family)